MIGTNGSSPTWPRMLPASTVEQANSGVLLTLSGRGILTAPTVLAGIDGVTAIRQLDDDPD